MQWWFTFRKGYKQLMDNPNMATREFGMNHGLKWLRNEGGMVSSLPFPFPPLPSLPSVPSVPSPPLPFP